MHGEIILMAMACGALVALMVIWPFWVWSLDRTERRTIKWLNEIFDKGQKGRDDESN